MTASSVRDDLIRAQSAVGHGRWAEAIEYVRSALAIGASAPDDFFSALHLASWAHFQSGGRDAARAVYARHAALMWRLLQGGDVQPAWMRAALDAAILAEDFTTIRMLFQKIYCPAWTGIDLTVSRRSSLVEWSQGSGTQPTVIDPAHVEADGLGRWTYTTDPLQALWVTHGQVLLGWDFVVTPDGAVLADSGHYPLDMTHGAFPHYFGVDRVVHPWQPTPIEVDADVLVMTAPPDRFIGHWIIDFLPRLRALPQGDVKIVIPDDLPQKLRDLLPLFGVDGARLMPLARGRRYRFRRVLAVHTGDPHQPSAATVQFVGEALRRPGPKRERLFLRRNMASRSIVNQSELDAVLDRHGFVQVPLAELSIAQQQERIGCAEAVIAVYGSDLLANLFMPPGSHLVELNYDPQMLNAGAAPRSAFLGVQHHLVTCQRAAARGVVGHRKDSDFQVDCVALERLLRDILAGP